MAEFVFQGESALTLDGKGRLSVPARHRDALTAIAGGQLTVTKHPARCLALFPRPAWQLFRDKLMSLPMDAERWRRVYLGSAQDVEIDSAARVLVSPELRAWAGLEREVTLLGVGSRLELWNRETYAAHEAAVLAEPMPEALRNFVL